MAAAYGYAVYEQISTTIIFGLVGGIVGAALLVAFYFLGVFLLGVLLGGSLGFLVSMMAQIYPEPTVLLIIAIIFGVLALVFQKFMIIVSTAFGGAWAVVTGIAVFITGTIDLTDLERMIRFATDDVYLILLSWLALGIVGVIVQYKSVPTKAE